MTQLLLVLQPFGELLEPYLPEKMMPVFPFYTTVSRISYKPEVFDCKLVSDYIPSFMNMVNHKLTYGDVCDKRAIELLKISGDIFVMWSGGIDSTCVLVSILKNWPAQELKRITVLCNTDSIKENKKFLPIITKNFKIETSSDRIEEFLKRGHVITGELGDQLFGSDIVGECVRRWGDSVIKMPWQEVAPRLFEEFSPDKGKPTYSNYVEIVKESPIELKTVHDFFWWLNFSQKWQHVKLRTLGSKTWTNPKLYFPKLVHFYETIDFQVWSLHNQDKKIKDKWVTYKYTSKDYIVDYSKDTDYTYKLKLPSLFNLYVGTDFNWSVDEDWNFLSKEDTIKRIIND